MLLFIKNLYYVPAGRMYGAIIHDVNTIHLRYNRLWQKLPTVGMPECLMTRTRVNGSMLTTVSLKATLSQHVELASGRYCFLLETVEGERYVLGFSEYPYPLVSVEMSIPADIASPAAYNLTVQLSSEYCFFRVLDNV